MSEFLQLGCLGGPGSMGYFEGKGRVITVMRLTSILSLFRKNWALSIRSSSDYDFLSNLKYAIIENSNEHINIDIKGWKYFLPCT